MAILHNRVSQKELKEKLLQETVFRKTLSFYKYFHINDPQLFRDEMFKQLLALNVFGRIYIAHEGINAQLSVPEINFEAFKVYINSIKELEGLRLNEAVDNNANPDDKVGRGKSFWVLKIKVRDKIVADGIKDPEFDMDNKGHYVDPVQFNLLTEDPKTIVIDMRNHYEYEIGHFENAIEIPSDTFRDQLPMAVDMMQEKKDRNIIMYCTGGIRCEKASAWMLHNGFTNVFHLEGGIINYANIIKEYGLQNKFKGKNFVFDNRLGEMIGEEVISTCHQCGSACDSHTNCANSGCHLLFIQCKNCANKFAGSCSKECYDFIQLPEEEQKELRKGMDKGRNIFNKSKEKMRLKFGNK